MLIDSNIGGDRWEFSDKIYTWETTKKEKILEELLTV